MGLLDFAADLAAVVGASRSIATKHAALRTRQLGPSFPAAARATKNTHPEKVPPKESLSSNEGEVPAARAASAEGTTHVTPKDEVDVPFQEHTQAPQFQKDIQDSGETIVPSFIKRAQFPASAPPSVLQKLRPASIAQGSGGPPRPHPLDPRFNKQRHDTIVEESQALAKSTPVENIFTPPKNIVDAIQTDVFRGSHTSKEPEKSVETHKEDNLPAIDELFEAVAKDSLASDTTISSSAVHANTGLQPQRQLPSDEEPLASISSSPKNIPESPPGHIESPGLNIHETVQNEKAVPASSTVAPAEEAAPTVARGETALPANPVETVQKRAFELKESKVPASRLSRMWNYGGLAAGMLGGALTESISRSFGGGSTNGGSVMLSAGNLERLVSRLSRMRGAALKLGQMMSFQDAKMLPGPLQEVLQRVQDGADYMPAWQRDRVLVSNLGTDWRDLFSEFEEKPLAAASIGQVHRAMLRSSGTPVAVKIQFPGVADSINSDLDNLAILLTATRMLPRGLYLDKTIANARTELAWECDYLREAECAQRFRTLLADAQETGADGVFAVPEVFPEASGKQVLTMSFMAGVGVTKVAPDLTQTQRDWIGTQILRLCLLEITQFRFMQTDPNWTNFLYNADTSKLELLDFGASREYPAIFVDQYVRLLRAAAHSDLDGVQELSRKLGYLTGHESRAMLDAHTQSVLTLAEPFREDSPDVYDFQDQTITDRVRSFIPIMVRERLSPPPEETYSLHRKLSGAFLLCARLGSRVPCRGLFDDSLKKMNLQ